MNTQRMKIFEYALLWHPSQKQQKEEGQKTKLLVEPKWMLAPDEKTALMAAAMEIPKEHREELEQVEIAVRAF